MPRFTDQPRKTITVRTSPTDDGRMVQLYIVDAGGRAELLGSVTPNILKGLGILIDVHAPESWRAEVQLSESFLAKFAKSS